MKIEESNLKNKLKENPFTVPEGYMEGLTDRIMQQIPEKVDMPIQPKITFIDKVRPFLYMAAMFAGLGLFFKSIAKIDVETTQESQTNSLLVNNSLINFSEQSTKGNDYTEDDVFLDYLEEQYTNVYIQEAIDNIE